MKPEISFCLIGKNEENCIETCLKSLKPFGLPIIYTDTGSSDRTREIASRYTQHICFFPWCDDFSKARNFCAAQADTDWIWFLDCDESVVESDLDALFHLLSQPQNETRIGMVSQRDTFLLASERTFTQTRLGRIYNRKFCHYEGSIHEQIRPLSPTVGNAGVLSSSDSNAGALSSSDSNTGALSSSNGNAGALSYFDVPALLVHDGYATPAVMAQKCARNIPMLLHALSRTEDPYLYYQLGKAYTATGDISLAEAAYEKGLTFDLDPALSYVQEMVTSYGYCLLDEKKYSTALSFTGIYDAFCSSADFVFLMGLIYMHNARFYDAIREFEKAASFPACVVDGVNSYRAFHNIGVIYECLGQNEKAVCFYEKCGSFSPARARLEVLRHA